MLCSGSLALFLEVLPSSNPESWLFRSTWRRSCWILISILGNSYRLAPRFPISLFTLIQYFSITFRYFSISSEQPAHQATSYYFWRSFSTRPCLVLQSNGYSIALSYTLCTLLHCSKPLRRILATSTGNHTFTPRSNHSTHIRFWILRDK